MEAVGDAAGGQTAPAAEKQRDPQRREQADQATADQPPPWAERTGYATVAPDPTSTAWCLSLYELPMPDVNSGQAITLSNQLRDKGTTVLVHPGNQVSMDDYGNIHIHLG